MDPRGERLSEQLRAAAVRLAEWRRLDAEAKALDDELARHDARDDRVRRRAGRTAQELERLRGFGARSLLLRLTGRAGRARADAEARLEQARSEQVACEAAMEPLHKQRDALAARLAKVAAAVPEHAQSVAEKEQWLRDVRHAAVATLDAIHERLAVVATNRTALAAGLGAARIAAPAVQAAIDALWNARSPSKVRTTDVGLTIAMSMLDSRGRAKEAQAHVDYAMRSVATLAAALQRVRTLAVVDLDELVLSSAPFAPGSATNAPAGAPEDELPQLLAEVRQVTWTFERADKALAALNESLAAERVACIEAAQ